MWSEWPECFCETHIAGTCDTVVVTVCPAAAVGHPSVLALYHTVCIKHRGTIAVLGVLARTRLVEMYEGTGNRTDDVYSHSHTGQHESGGVNCSLRGQVRRGQFRCKQVQVRS